MAVISETLAKKLSKEEIQKIQELEKKYQLLTTRIGQVTIDLETLSKLKNTLFNEYGNIQQEEKKLVDNLNKTYGEGTIDPSD
ncbi:MAG: hypothetical protein H8E13_20120 [Actinobacteria bacterium]|nr:hypothetical protein [Actinomycetota bacterium]